VRQFVLTGSFAEPYVQLVDNSLAFSSYRNPDIPAVDDFSLLQVPALPRKAIDGLRHADPDTLAVIEQYRIDPGILVKTRRTAPADRRRPLARPRAASGSRCHPDRRSPPPHRRRPSRRRRRHHRPLLMRPPPLEHHPARNDARVPGGFSLQGRLAREMRAPLRDPSRTGYPPCKRNRPQSSAGGHAERGSRGSSW